MILLARREARGGVIQSIGGKHKTHKPSLIRTLPMCDLPLISHAKETVDVEASIYSHGASLGYCCGKGGTALLFLQHQEQKVSTCHPRTRPSWVRKRYELGVPMGFKVASVDYRPMPWRCNSEKPVPMPSWQNPLPYNRNPRSGTRKDSSRASKRHTSWLWASDRSRWGETLLCRPKGPAFRVTLYCFVGAYALTLKLTQSEMRMQ